MKARPVASAPGCPARRCRSPCCVCRSPCLCVSVPLCRTYRTYRIAATRRDSRVPDGPRAGLLRLLEVVEPRADAVAVAARDLLGLERRLRLLARGAQGRALREGQFAGLRVAAERGHRDAALRVE